MRAYAVATALLVWAGASGSAQGGGLATPVCPAASTILFGIPDAQRMAQDGCEQAYDVFEFLAPQLGAALTGGNAVLGSAQPLDGLARYSLDVGAGGFEGRMPAVSQFTQSPNGVQVGRLPS